MTKQITFSNADIMMARDGDLFILWDRNVNVFGTGRSYSDALNDLADDYKGEKR